MKTRGYHTKAGPTSVAEHTEIKRGLQGLSKENAVVGLLQAGQNKICMDDLYHRLCMPQPGMGVPQCRWELGAEAWG